MEQTTTLKAGERTQWSVVRKHSDFLVYRGSKLFLGYSRNEVPNNGGFAIRMNLFGGAGYCGFTVFLAWRSGSRLWINRHRGGIRINGKPYSLFTRLTSVEIGATRNWNAIPHTSH